MLPLNHQFILIDEPHAYADAAAKAVAANVQSSATRPFLISLSGGSTPFPVYQKLAPMLAQSGIANNCFWMQTDERLVDADDERSNQRGIMASLMAGGFLAQSSFFAAPVGRGLAIPSESAFAELCQSYQRSLLGLPSEIRPPAPIDLLLLGVGADGHTASLFTDTDWQKRSSDSGFAVFSSASQPEPRLSLTLERILQARQIIFMVSGASKAAILQKIFFEPDDSIPAAYIATRKKALWILDSEAAGRNLARLITSGNLRFEA
ncbi:MAG TPA: 6-phosphogluconolactonase [Candidatus Rifleibacterium sp.]|nr:6-phosphogluconolactonase [Candidatus Rifleibacterium sp.]HPT46963.1 6-phosphogluconolactonase [Candidatus Rifleibacterium sp.]